MNLDSYFNIYLIICRGICGFFDPNHIMSKQYIGDNCEVDIDECAPKPCVNGECEDGIAEFTCICNKGYEGPLCDIEIDECERYDPCVHGTCTGKTTYDTQ